MRVLVFLGTGVDVRVAPQRDPRSGRVREEWLVREVDPASARALDLALELKTAGSVVRDHDGVEVTVVHLGPEAHELWLQQALARGCDRAIRVWDEEAADLHAAGAAVVLAAAAQAAGFDVVLVRHCGGCRLRWPTGSASGGASRRAVRHAGLGDPRARTRSRGRSHPGVGRWLPGAGAGRAAARGDGRSTCLGRRRRDGHSGQGSVGGATVRPPGLEPGRSRACLSKRYAGRKRRWHTGHLDHATRG